MLLPLYISLSPHPSIKSSFAKLFSTHSKSIHQWLYLAALRDPALSARFVDLAAHLKDAIQLLIDGRPFSFAIELHARTSDRRESIKLSNWLSIKLQEAGPSFAVAAINFIRENLESAQNTQEGGEYDLLRLSIETLSVFFRSLIANKSLLSADLQNNLNALLANATAVYPSLAASLASSSSVDDVDEEATDFMIKVFGKVIPLGEVVDIIQRLKSSDKKRDRELFACIIHHLFDEYKFFPKYPLSLIHLSATLYGLFIQHRILSNISLGIALRFVIDALRQPDDTKMFQFGVWAVDQFKSRLPQWPQYCSLILQIPHLLNSQPELVAYLNALLASSSNGFQATNGLSSLPLTSPVIDGDIDFGAGSAFANPPTGAFGEFPYSSITGSLDDKIVGRPSANISRLTPIINTNTSPPRSPSASPSPAPGPSGLSATSPNMQPLTKADEAKNGAALTATAAATSALTATPPAGRKNTSGALSQPFGATLNIDSLLAAEAQSKPVIEPPDQIKDKIHFIINNVSKTNMKTKARELKALMKPEWFVYFGRYFVVKRVSIEPNFQKLYAAFLEGLSMPELRKIILETTYENVKVLLSTDKIVNSASERALLKNLGSWLGLLTIARNQPVRSRHLNLKELILDAYDNGRLIAVIPFCAKVLESCGESKVFKLPNPWISALVGLLREIFDLPNLKLNLKFEIEVLFNRLSSEIQIKDVRPTNLLKDRPPKQQAMQNFSNALPQGNSTPPTKGFIDKPSTANAGTPARISGRSPSPPANAEENDVNGARNAAQNSNEPILIPNLAAYVNINAAVQLFNVYPQYKAVVPTAVERAIREIMSPVVERSVTIACVTSRELIMKDFSLESDETKMRQSAHHMVQNLTASLALVTCKEPLRVSINNHLLALLEPHIQQSDRPLVEQACLAISADNLELGCTLIEKTAAERACREIDEALSPHYNIRRKHRETTGQGYVETSAYTSGARWPAALPDILRPKPGALTSSQLRVYEDFGRIRQHYANAVAGKEVNQPQSAPVTPSVPSANKVGRSSPPPQQFPPPNRPNAVPTPLNMAAAAVNSSRSPPLQGTVNQQPPTGPPSNQQISSQQIVSLQAQQMLDKLVNCMSGLEQAVLRYPNHKSMPLHSLTTSANQGREELDINNMLRMMQALLAAVPRDESVPRDLIFLTFAHRVTKRLYERENRTSLLQIDVHIAVLKCVRSVCPKLVQELTGWLFYGEGDDRKFLLPITAGLLRARLLHVPDVDAFLHKLSLQVAQSGQTVQTAANPAAATTQGAPATIAVLHPHLEFVLALIRRVVIKRAILQVVELQSTLEALSKIAQQARHKLVSDAINILLNDVRAAAELAEREREQQQLAAAAGAPPGVPSDVDTGKMDGLVKNAEGKLLDDEEVDVLDRETDEPEPSGVRQQVVFLLDEWMNICLQGNASDKAYGQYILLLQQHRVLATPESTSRFFRIIIQLCFESAAAANNNNNNNEEGRAPYTAIDALGKLFVFLLKFYDQSAAGASQPPSNISNANKIRLLQNFLNSIAHVLRRDAEHLKNTFNQRPYLRLFANLLHDLNTPDPTMLDSNNPDVLLAFGMSFHLLRPNRVPQFAFAWLELIAHRMFMSKLLLSKNTACSITYARLLVDLFRFLQPYLREAALTESIRLLYKGTLRLLLVLLHDFPEFLCEFHFSFCDVIPPCTIQMRNLILSAFPRNMRLPDPFTPNLKVDLLPEISQPPRIVSDVTAALASGSYRNQLMIPLDSYLKTRQPATFVKSLISILEYDGDYSANASAAVRRNGTLYNVPLINSLVMYVGMQSIAALTNASKNGLSAQFQDSPGMDIFEALVTALDPEGRYYVLNAIANQLRYPNNHTHYFSCVLLYLFLQCKDDITVMEQITRVLLERLIVHRPHPWGLLITFIELIRNPRYEFWKQPFTRCAPEIERLFESVARSCMPNAKPNLSIQNNINADTQPSVTDS